MLRLPSLLFAAAIVAGVFAFSAPASASAAVSTWLFFALLLATSLGLIYSPKIIRDGPGAGTYAD